MCRFEFYGWLNLGHFPLLFYRCLFVNKIKRTLHGGLKIYEFVTWNHILKRWFITGGRCGCTWTWCMLIYGLVDVDTLFTTAATPSLILEDGIHILIFKLGRHFLVALFCSWFYDSSFFNDFNVLLCRLLNDIFLHQIL